MFRKYDHVERLGHENVDGILFGDVYVFPKLDGTNASIWFKETDSALVEICAGSRTRQLSLEADNAGFLAWVCNSPMFNKIYELYNQGHKDWIIYGEWLVPHTLKTYRSEAWRKFWVFDVYSRSKGEYLHYEQWEPTIRGVGLDVIDPMAVYTNPTAEQLQAEVLKNTYLITDGSGLGEGIVLKNYSWSDKFGRQPWAKLVRNEFKEENKRAFGLKANPGEFQVEVAIAEKYVTDYLVSKTRAKVRTNYITTLEREEMVNGLLEGEESDDAIDRIEKRVEERHRAQIIPRLLDTVYHDLIIEELWEALKEHNFPVVDFKKLRTCAILQTKKHAKDLF